MRALGLDMTCWCWRHLLLLLLLRKVRRRYMGKASGAGKKGREGLARTGQRTAEARTPLLVSLVAWQLNEAALVCAAGRQCAHETSQDTLHPTLQHAVEKLKSFRDPPAAARVRQAC
jgi:hypothetical protein